MPRVDANIWQRELAEMADRRVSPSDERVFSGLPEEKKIYVAQISGEGMRSHVSRLLNFMPTGVPVAVHELHNFFHEAQKETGEPINYIHDHQAILMEIMPSMAKAIHNRFVHHSHRAAWANLRFIEPLEDFVGNAKRHPSRISIDHAAQGLGRLLNKLDECRAEA